MSRQSLIVLILSVLFSVGGWMVALPHWADACNPGAIGGLLMNIAAVAAGSLGVNIQKKGN